jgi:hypothetical protein
MILRRLKSSNEAGKRGAIFAAALVHYLPGQVQGDAHAPSYAKRESIRIRHRCQLTVGGGRSSADTFLIRFYFRVGRKEGKDK